MLKKCPTECVYVGVGIFNLADRSKNGWDGLEALFGEVTYIVVFDVLVSESFQMHESGICISKNCVAISRDDSPFLQRFSDILFDD